MLKKAFLEITNSCNLDCDFCHKTSRPTKFLTKEEFTYAAKELRRVSEYLYFHIMGEPLLHPLLEEFFKIAGELGFKVIITTNGTLIPKRRKILLNSPSLHKVSISLHAYEANKMNITLDDYLDGCFDFCREASEKGIFCIMRLWNVGGEDTLNRYILDRMHKFFDGEWTKNQSGYKLCRKVFLEWGERFEWPDEDAPLCENSHSCYGLRNQVGVLSDGRVVPCCLDADGVLTLGNIFEEKIEDILASPRAVALKTSFENRKITEPLCLRCDFAARRVK